MSHLVKLNDLQSTEWGRKDLIVYGVVVASTKPKPTSFGANDKYTASYTLIDETLTLKRFVTLNLFGNDMNKFPVITNAGNVIRISMVKKTVHKGVVQLVGNLRKINYLMFYKKLNSITGFGVLPLPLTTPSSESPEETRLLTAEENHAREDILHVLEPCRGVAGVRIESQPTLPWVLFYYSHTGTPNNAAVPTAAHNQVHNLLSWAFKTFFSESMTDAVPLMEAGVPSADSRIKVPPHIPIRKVTRSDWGITAEQTRCDMVALVVQVILRENSMSELIVWDGTVSHGLLSKDSYAEVPNTLPSRVVVRKPDVSHKVSTFRDVCHGLFTSCMFASDTPAFLEKLKFILTSSHADDYNEFESNTLMGQAVCLTTADATLNSQISSLRPGQWVRLRNLHLDYSPFHSPMPRFNAGGLEMVASIYSDTHITPLYPFFRDAMTVANQYQKLLQLARANNTFPTARAAPYAQTSAPSSSSSSSSSSSAVNGAMAQSLLSSASSSTAAAVNTANRANMSAPQLVRSRKNSPIHPLAFALASIAPSKHCVRVRVTGLWPTTAAELVTDIRAAEAESTTMHAPHWVFMFALRVQDETATADVILFDKEAEIFLGVSAADYVSNEVVRLEVFARLQYLMEGIHSNAIVLELFLQSYHSVEKRSQRSVKRLAVLDTVLSESQV